MKNVSDVTRPARPVSQSMSTCYIPYATLSNPTGDTCDCPNGYVPDPSPIINCVSCSPKAVPTALAPGQAIAWIAKIWSCCHQCRFLLQPAPTPRSQRPLLLPSEGSCPDCNPFSDITDIRGLHPTSKQCYEVLKAQWPAVIQWYGKLFPHFTPPYTTTDPEVYALKIVLWLWIIHFSASVLSYNS